MYVHEPGKHTLMCETVTCSSKGNTKNDIKKLEADLHAARKRMVNAIYLLDIEEARKQAIAVDTLEKKIVRREAK